MQLKKRAQSFIQIQTQYRQPNIKQMELNQQKIFKNNYEDLKEQDQMFGSYVQIVAQEKQLRNESIMANKTENPKILSDVNEGQSQFRETDLANKKKGRDSIGDNITRNRSALQKFVNGEWVYSSIGFKKDCLIFQQRTYNVNNITKIKIFPNQIHAEHLTHKIIKMCYFDQKEIKDIYLSGSFKRTKKINSHFRIFAMVANLKITSLGLKLRQSEWNITPHKLLHITANSFTYGIIYKKSQFFQEWNERFVVVKKDGIYSYKSIDHLNHTMYIPAESVKYIWTRFEFIESFMIVKIKHGIFKTQFGIPISQFNKDTPNNWLLHFYQMAVQEPNVNGQEGKTVKIIIKDKH